MFQAALLHLDFELKQRFRAVERVEVQAEETVAEICDTNHDR